MRLNYRVFRDPCKEHILKGLSDACLEHSAHIYIDERLDDSEKEPIRFQAAWERLRKSGRDFVRLGSTDHTTSVYLPYFADDHLIVQSLGRRLGLPWFELRIQEGNHWDYSFYMGKKHLDQFSSVPSYWGEDKSKVKGNPCLIAENWGVPVESIQNYLKPWTSHRRGKKAYPSDRAPYGDYEQFYDFMRAIKAIEPTIDFFPIQLEKK